MDKKKNNEIGEITEYLRVASAHDVLTPQQERDLISKAQAGDLRARELLIKHNLRLVIKIAKKFHGKGLTIGDCVQEGILGLDHALDKFDQSKGFKFSTYFVRWVAQYINRATQNKGRLIRIPINKHDKASKIKKTYWEYRYKYQEAPSLDDLFFLLPHIPREEIAEIGRHLQDIDSLDKKTKEGEDDHLTKLHYLADERNNFEQTAEDVVDKEKLTELLSILDREDRMFLEYRFSLLDRGKTKTYGQIASLFDMTIDQVKKKELLIFEKLRSVAKREDYSLEAGDIDKTFNLVVTSMEAGVLKMFPYVKKVPSTVMADRTLEDLQEPIDKLRMMGATFRIIPN